MNSLTTLKSTFTLDHLNVYTSDCEDAVRGYDGQLHGVVVHDALLTVHQDHGEPGSKRWVITV